MEIKGKTNWNRKTTFMRSGYGKQYRRDHRRITDTCKKVKQI